MKKYKKNIPILPLDQRRFKLLYIFNLLVILSLFGRLVNLQVFNASDLQRKKFVIKAMLAACASKRYEVRTRP